MKSVLNEDSALDSLLTAVTPFIDGAKGEYNKGKSRIEATAKDNYIGSSISSYTKNLVMSFPVLFDDTLSLETAQMISKANERNIVTMLEMMFASMSLSGTNGASIIGNFHKNINENMDMTEIMDALDEMVEDSDIPEVSKAQIRDAVNEMCFQLRQPAKRFPENSFSERSLNEYVVRNSYSGIVVSEASNSPYTDEEIRQKDEEKEEREQRKEKREIEKAEREQRKEKRDIAKSSRDEAKDNVQLAKSMILDGDFKKANELQPTTLIINMNELDQDNHVVGRKSFIAGVKCRLINASAIDIVERLVAKNKSKLSFKNLLRATTGEIHLVKDFLLCIKQAKINAKNAVKKGDVAKMWNTLEKRSSKNTMNKVAKASNDATAVTTLVVNQETANYMKSGFGLDITKIADAKHLMDEYNLLCLVIADDANESAKFLYDGNNSFEVMSYTNLNKDNKDEAMRKALNAVTRR